MVQRNIAIVIMTTGLAFLSNVLITFLLFEPFTLPEVICKELWSCVNSAASIHFPKIPFFKVKWKYTRR